MLCLEPIPALCTMFAAAALLGCGSAGTETSQTDGSSDPDTAGTTTSADTGQTGGPGSTQGASDPTGASDPGTSTTAASSATEPSESASDDTTTGGPSPEGVCPQEAFPDSPLPRPDMTAAALDDASTSVGAGGLLEGPVWWNGALVLSHFWFQGQPPPASILRYEPGVGLTEIFGDSGSNGLAIGIDGGLIGGDHAQGAISSYDPNAGVRTVLVDGYEGQRFNSPNDLTVAADGTLYFTDPDYQAPQPRPQPVTGVYRVTPEGIVDRFEDGLTQPNGISLAPEGDVLYVGHPGGVQRYDLMPDGSVVTPGSSWGSGLSGVDGMAIDCAGNLYVTLHSEGRIVVLDPDGAELGEIAVAPQLTNAAFGGPQRRTLYMTAGNPDAGNAVYSVELSIPGFPY